MRHRIVVVGAGAAGGSAAQTVAASAADNGADVEVVVVGLEGRRPYNRTTVNKGLLSGAVTEGDIGLTDVDHQNLSWRLGRRAVGLDTGTRTVHLDDGSALGADAVVVATGAVPRVLPVRVQPEIADRVVYLRTPADTARLRSLAPAGRVVVAGVGLIGSELPGALGSLTSEVTLVDPAPHPLHRHVGPLVGRWIADEHRRAGVGLQMGKTIAAVHGPDDPQASARLSVELDDGTRLDAAAVVGCLGVVPDTAWLAGSGLDLDAPTGGGIRVDQHQRVEGADGVYAAGDVAAVPGPDGEPVRIEHWGSAIQQGRRAARSVMTDLSIIPLSDESVPAVYPSYSTYVGDAKLTIIGWRPTGSVERVVHGTPEDPRFLVVHLVGDTVVGAVGVGGARAANRIRPLVEAAAPVQEVENALRDLVRPSGDAVTMRS